MIKSIKKRPINIFLIAIVVILYLINNLFIKKHSSGLANLFFSGYFNDLLCPIAFLSYINILLLTRNIEITKPKTVILICLVSSIIWELLTPLIKKNSVGDPIDVLCYVLGGLVYCYIIAREAKK